MPVYKAPLRDMRFVLHELWKTEEQLACYEQYEEATEDMIDAILEEAAKLAENEFLPLNREGDEEGCRLEDGKVYTPKGFKEAYKAYAEGGWCGLACDPEYGGQGLPVTLNTIVEEMVCSANVSFSLYPSLTFGAYHAIEAHASDELKAIYLPKMIEGTWSGAMDMTEAGAGSDLGLLRTKAEPNGDGSYSITGTKIFITAGDHDLTENIVHLVLARLPDAPKGTRGISMFLVPKYLPDADGEVGEANALSVGSIEHKMGIKASSTCVMNYDGAKGWLVGKPNRGLIAMFTMMNSERLFVGLQGLGLSEASYQNAVEYCKERLQGRDPSGVKCPDKAADPIIVHPNIRNDLLFARSFNEAARALQMFTAINLDKTYVIEDKDEKTEAADFVALLTPVVKAAFTDFGYEATTRCQGTFGGHGYIREWGMEQYVRDCRITQIYEGTNHIQAMDLIGRKIAIHNGRLINRLYDMIDSFVAENKGNDKLAAFVAPLEKAAALLKEVTTEVIKAGGDNRAVLQAVCMDYLHLFAIVAFGYTWARMAAIAVEKMGQGDDDFYQAKLVTGRYFMKRVLPRTISLAEMIRTGAEPVTDMPEELF
jgi:alkylation response protein AidB-like acyl-CoA dehydrogenase